MNGIWVRRLPTPRELMREWTEGSLGSLNAMMRISRKSLFVNCFRN
jgi:hypothetical protein